MADIQGFLSEARQSGYSDDEIDQYLRSQGQDTSSLGLNTWSNFVSKAQDIAKQNNFPTSVLLGQAALESGRGKATPGFNYFGIKGEGNAGSNNLSTQEADPNGNYYTTNSAFRSYKSPEDSINDYINLIKTNYPDAWAKRNDPLAMLQAIKQGGYATSPDYVIKVAQTPEFQQFYGLGK